MEFCNVLYTCCLIIPWVFHDVQSEELLAAVVLFRHGDRSISESFPTDPYQNSSYWPEGYGQLLDKGKLRSYELGKWLRTRYSQLLSNNYKKNETYVASSDEDRCLMSAACVLAGLFEPTGKSSQLPGILGSWDPVPVHSRPKLEDPFLAMLAPCPKWTEEYANLKKEEYFTNICEKYSDLFTYVSNKTGWAINDIEYMRYLYKVLYIYSQHNSSFTHSWFETMDVADREIIKKLAGLSFAMETYTYQLKRLSAGLFMHNLLEYLNSFVQDKHHLKVVLLSGHDTSITGVLNTMGCYDDLPPEFSSAIMWEVYKDSRENYTVRMFYRKSPNSDTVEALKLKACDYDCDYQTFIKLLSPYAVNEKRRQKECNS